MKRDKISCFIKILLCFNEFRFFNHFSFYHFDEVNTRLQVAEVIDLHIIKMKGHPLPACLKKRPAISGAGWDGGLLRHSWKRMKDIHCSSSWKKRMRRRFCPLQSISHCGEQLVNSRSSAHGMSAVVAALSGAG